MRNDKFLGTIQLLSGAHKRGQGMCAMEAAAYLAGEPHSDHPECVSPVIAAFMRGWNDGMRSDAERELLKPWVVKVLHTRTTPQDEETRAWLAVDWLVRVQNPAWLDLAKRPDAAQSLRNLPALTSTEILVSVQSIIEHAQREAAAAWAAARAAAWAAARAAAWAALEPTVQQLQASAFALLDRMIAVGTVAERPVARETVSPEQVG